MGTPEQSTGLRKGKDMLIVKILGSGCANCRRLEEVARKAASDAGIEAEFVKVTDYKDILAYGVLTTPGLVVNEKLVSSGRIPAPATIAQWLTAARGDA
jgi:small redox-active disulfide protein 2